MEIFWAYDIRGIYPDEVNEEVVFKIAAALVKFLNPDKLIVGYDSRKSSEPLKESVIMAITASGVDVIDIGSTSSPLFYFAVNKLAAGGGVMITPSHNRPEYNGLKLVREKGIVLGEDSGLGEIRNLAGKIEISATRKGKVMTRDLSQEYIDFLLEKSDFEKEPETPENIRFEFDPDQDRLLVFEDRKEVRADLLAGAIAKDFLEKRSFLAKLFKPRFVYDLRFSKAIPEFIKENGGVAVRSRVGHPFIKEAMRKNKALFGAELSGHFYFKDVFYVEAPILMKLKILKILQETEKSINELIQPFNKYFHSGEINLEIKDKEQAERVIQKLKEIYKDGKSDELDGIAVEYLDPVRGREGSQRASASNGASWWFNLRPSNTESVMRLVVEAETQYLMEQKVKEVTEVVRRFSA